MNTHFDIPNLLHSAHAESAPKGYNMSHVVLILISFVFGLLLALTTIWVVRANVRRLALYDQWYACMYQGWDYDRCSLLVYGDKIK